MQKKYFILWAPTVLTRSYLNLRFNPPGYLVPFTLLTVLYGTARHCTYSSTFNIQHHFLTRICPVYSTPVALRII